VEIVTYGMDMSVDVTALFNRELAGVPFCWEAKPDKLSHSLDGYELSESVKSGDDRLRNERVIVVLDAGRPVGFAIVGVELPTKQSPRERGIISFLLYERGSRKAGQTLLDGVHRYLRECVTGEVVAFPQSFRFTPYHIKAAYLSEHLDHVQALLAVNGYARDCGEVYLAGDTLPEDDVEAGNRLAGIDTKIMWENGGGELPNLTMKAFLGDDDIAECKHYSLGAFSDNPEAEATAFCVWLGVEDQYQGRGLGAYLLNASLIELRKRGFTRMAISTAHNNDRAFVFYANYGYRVVDWTWSYVRRL
jgi:GNAT superfamily N-acetyltransferase